MKRIVDFLREVGVYYLATVENGKPKVRPFSTINLYDGKLYISTGKGKAVSNQLLADPNAELCGCKDKMWVRVEGKLIEDDSDEARASMIEAYPSLQKRYINSEDEMQVFYFTKGHAAFCVYGKPDEVIAL